MRTSGPAPPIVPLRTSNQVQTAVISWGPQTPLSVRRLRRTSSLSVVLLPARWAPSRSRRARQEARPPAARSRPCRPTMQAVFGRFLPASCCRCAGDAARPRSRERSGGGQCVPLWPLRPRGSLGFVNDCRQCLCISPDLLLGAGMNPSQVTVRRADWGRSRTAVWDANALARDGHQQPVHAYARSRASARHRRSATGRAGLAVTRPALACPNPQQANTPSSSLLGRTQAHHHGV